MRKILIIGFIATATAYAQAPLFKIEDPLTKERYGTYEFKEGATISVAKRDFIIRRLPRQPIEDAKMIMIPAFEARQANPIDVLKRFRDLSIEHDPESKGYRFWKLIEGAATPTPVVSPEEWNALRTDLETYRKSRGLDTKPVITILLANVPDWDMLQMFYVAMEPEGIGLAYDIDGKGVVVTIGHDDAWGPSIRIPTRKSQ